MDVQRSKQQKKKKKKKNSSRSSRALETNATQGTAPTSPCAEALNVSSTNSATAFCGGIEFCSKLKASGFSPTTKVKPNTAERPPLNAAGQIDKLID